MDCEVVISGPGPVCLQASKVHQHLGAATPRRLEFATGEVVTYSVRQNVMDDATVAAVLIV
jgi:hypothetical protein